MKLKSFTKQFKGSSFPTLIETEDNHRYILKMRGSGNGALSLVSEFIANKAAHAAGFPVPDAEWIEIPDKFPWTFGTDEFDDIVQKSYGWNLGIEFIPDARPVSNELSADEDPVLLNSIYTIDLFFINADRTGMSDNLLMDPEGKIWIIDHGFLGLFHSFKMKSNDLFSNHVFQKLLDKVQLKFDLNLCDPILFSKIVEMIPGPLLKETPFTKQSLLELLNKRIKELI